MARPDSPFELAATAADRFLGGVWFVDLTPERNGALVPERCLAAMGLVQPLTDEFGDSIDVLEQATAGRPTLLILDNCEHVVDGAADFAEAVLRRAPSVTILATSREVLSVEGERVWRVPGLGEACAELFLARAAASGAPDVNGRMDLIGRICTDLDEIPLAIELAAAQTAWLSVEELAARLDRPIFASRGRRATRGSPTQAPNASDDDGMELRPVVRRGTAAPERARGLCRVLPARRSRGGCYACETPALARLASLVDKSLVVRLPDDGRFRLLETVRLYAQDRLVASEGVVGAQDRHLGWIHQSLGYKTMLALSDDDVQAYEHAARADIENVIAAMEWADSSGDTDLVFDIFMGSSPVWFTEDSVSRVAHAWLQRIPLPPPEARVDRANWLSIAALVHYSLGDVGIAYEYFVEAAGLAETLSENRSGGGNHLVRWPAVQGADARGDG